jgi:hypothetical protein
MKAATTGLTLAAVLLAGCAMQPAAPRVSNLTDTGGLGTCEQVTGSRIRNPERTDCEPTGYPFKSFSRDELQATGEIDLIDALRQLDPAFQ